MVRECQFTVYGNPITKKNSQQIIRTKQGRSVIIPSKQYKKYEVEAIRQIDLPEGFRAIDEPVNVCCVYYMETHRRVDLSNLLEATTDVLVAAGVLADDNRDIVAALNGSVVMYDKENPRVMIEITPMYGYEQWKKAAGDET